MRVRGITPNLIQPVPGAGAERLCNPKTFGPNPSRWSACKTQETSSTAFINSSRAARHCYSTPVTHAPYPLSVGARFTLCETGYGYRILITQPGYHHQAHGERVRGGPIERFPVRHSPHTPGKREQQAKPSSSQFACSEPFSTCGCAAETLSLVGFYNNSNKRKRMGGKQAKKNNGGSS